MADVVFDQLILGVADSAASQAIRNTGNAYVLELKWLNRGAAGSAAWDVKLQASNDLEAWEDVSSTYSISGATTPPYRYVWKLVPGGSNLNDLVDAYAYVRVHVKNSDTAVTQLLTVTLAITRYNT